MNLEDPGCVWRDQGIKTWHGVKEDENTFRPPERRRMWEVSDYFERGWQCWLFWERPQRTRQNCNGECSASASACTKKQIEMFLHKFRVIQASLSDPLLVTYTDHVLAPHNAHGKHFWFASLIQFNLNNLCSECMAGALYCWVLCCQARCGKRVVFCKNLVDEE